MGISSLHHFWAIVSIWGWPVHWLWDSSLSVAPKELKTLGNKRHNFLMFSELGCYSISHPSKTSSQSALWWKVIFPKPGPKAMWRQGQYPLISIIPWIRYGKFDILPRVAEIHCGSHRWVNELLLYPGLPGHKLQVLELYPPQRMVWLQISLSYNLCLCLAVLSVGWFSVHRKRPLNWFYWA